MRLIYTQTCHSKYATDDISMGQVILEEQYLY